MGDLEEQDTLLRRIFFDQDPREFLKQIGPHECLSHCVIEDVKARRPDAIIREIGYEKLFSAPTYLKIRESKEPWAEEIRSLPDYQIILPKQIIAEGNWCEGVKSVLTTTIVFNIEIKTGAFFDAVGCVLNIEREIPTLYIIWRANLLKAVWARDLPKNPEWIKQTQINERYRPIAEEYYKKLRAFFPTVHEEKFITPPPPPYSGDTCLKIDLEMLPDYFELMNTFLGARQKEYNSYYNLSAKNIIKP